MSTKESEKIFAEFYDRLKDLKSSHKRNPSHAAERLSDEQYEMMLLAKIPQPDVQFSGEERYGKYLDLQEFYNRFLNSKFSQLNMDYTTYVDNFPSLVLDATIPHPRSKATSEEYKDYVSDLLGYLVSFMDRTQPLMFLDRIFSNLEARDDDFEEEPTTNKKKRRRIETNVALRVMKAKVEKLCEILKETIERTRRHVKNRQGMTYSELVEDRRETDDDDDFGGGFESGDEEDDKEEYRNPLKVPLGWDGKPIPYWLYKLHGLDKEFKCQICGDRTYRGRREFERHFSEARHQQGLKCLGIAGVYAKSFHEITVIDDAKTLWEVIRSRERGKLWNPKIDEEFEDSEGNVYSNVTYTDLKKQGLV